jgi:hypothetical protein
MIESGIGKRVEDRVDIGGSQDAVTADDLH